MEELKDNIISIILWLIVACISVRHLYVNWRMFKLAYRNVQFVSMLVLLPLLLGSIWSDEAIVLFLVFSPMLSYMKVYKSRVERGSFVSIIDDKFLVLSYPLHKEETLEKFRMKVYWWHLMYDMLALLLVCALGALLDRIDIILSIIKMI